jgi:short-subunit dehydrogenase
VFTATAADAEKARLQRAPRSYFLVPLQLSTDYQIRAHSPFRDGREAVREIIASFARSGSRRELVFVAHPLDNGLIAWNRVVARLAREFGVADRVLSLPGGTPPDLLRNAAGVVTINSTIGVTALYIGVPVKPLGNAVFDVPGLTCQQPLDRFWESPVLPDPALMAAFLRALVGTTQVKGGYYERASQACAIAGCIERLENRPYPLPSLTPADFAARPPRLAARSVVVAGVSNGVGLALARAHAGPGIRVVLIGADPAVLERAAGDCRHRGALVESFCASGRPPEAVAAYLDEVDRQGPIDDLLIQVDGASDGAHGAFGAAMDVAALLAETMRRRGRGNVVLLSGLAGRSAQADAPAALAARTALVEHGTALRRLMSADGVGVAIVVPGTIALRAGARLGAPWIAELGIERIGEAIGRGLRRHREVIPVPGPAVAARRALRAAFGKLRRAMRESVPPLAVPEPEAPLPLARESASAD